MQTFLPYSDFTESAKTLDRQRLGKQRVETWQIYQALTGEKSGWANHPATKMWRGCEVALLVYGIEICLEWKARGYNDTMLSRFLEALDGRGEEYVPPAWLGDQAFHLSHQSNLSRKLPAHYGPLWPEVSPELPYVWP